MAGTYADSESEHIEEHAHKQMSENSTPPERPLNSIKLTLHTHTQAHTHIFFSFKNTSARASIVQGGQSTA